MKKLLTVRIPSNKRVHLKSSKSEVVKLQTNATKDIPEDRRLYLPTGGYVDRNDPMVDFYLSRVLTLL